MENKILIVDDSKADRELILEVLKADETLKDFNYLEAEDGENAIEVLGTNHKVVCLIILDWQMPKMSGIEFMEAVINVPAVSSIPIVMVTASGTEENKYRAKAVNPNIAGYVVKPFDPIDLRSSLERVLKDSGAE